MNLQNLAVETKSEAELGVPYSQSETGLVAGLVRGHAVTVGFEGLVRLVHLRIGNLGYEAVVGPGEM